MIVVSMTTVPRRNGKLGPTIAALLAQDLRPDQIRLYLTPGCDPVPGVDNIMTEDIGPLTKLSAAREVTLPEDAIIVTADDDKIYDRAWLRTLVEAARRYPEEAVGLKGWNATSFLRAGAQGNYEEIHIGHCDVVEGFAGVAYRKKFFGEDVWKIPESCKYVDDVWISGYLFRRGIARRVVGSPLARSASYGAHGLHTRPDFVELNRNAARLMFDRPDHAKIFTSQFCDSSGPGSLAEATVTYRKFLEDFIRQQQIKKILDLGCGDLEVMSRVDLAGAEYLGVDLIEERLRRNRARHPHLRLVRGDARDFSMSGFDLVIVKDVLQHWATAEVRAWIDRFFASSAKTALVTNSNCGTRINTDIAPGGWRGLDLTKAPFSAGHVVFQWSLRLRDGSSDAKDVVQLQRKG